MFVRAAGLLVFAVCGVCAQAEHVCDTTISYKWMQGEETKEVFHSILKKKGADEGGAKELLAGAVPSQKKEAFEECEQIHENLAACLSARLLATTTARRMGTFSSRKALEDAINQDCERQTGRCLEALSSEPKCRELKDSSAEDAAEGDEKDKKKKK